MSSVKSVATVTIPNGGALSNAISLGEKTLVGIIVSAAWTAAGLTFQASEDNGATWLNLTDSTGTEVSIAAAGILAGGRVSIDPTPYIGVDMIRIRSGTNAAPVNQGAARVLTVIARKLYSVS